ncbi:MAG: NYN domain-containing protein, partial [Deltaproteobacteria bacterium]|nr:NYN domain-containing protein [Deltaproteobacteria bacterium]
MNPSNNNGTVLLIDVENVIGLCNTLKTEGLIDEIDIKPVCDKLTEMFGPLRYRKSFGDIAYSCAKTSNHHWIRSLRKNFYDNLIEMHDIPNFGGYKNMADMTIITEALSIAFDNQDVSVFAIFSSDADYVPLYTKLKERGKTVVIIGVTQEATSSILTKAADYLYYYKHLVTQDEYQNTALPIPNYYRNLVLRAAASILDQGVPLHGSALLNKIRQLQSDFDYKQLGFRKFIDFLKDIELTTSAISVNPHPDHTGDMTITLNETHIKNNFIDIPAARREVSPVSLPEEYRQALVKKLRCPVLLNKQYERCCAAIELVFRKEVLEKKSEEQEIKLVDLKNIVFNLLIHDQLFATLTSNGKNGDSLDSVLFKILKALYMTGVFYKSRSKDSDPVLDLFNNNPSLSVFYSAEPDLVERFYFSIFYILKSYDLPLNVDALVKLFFEEDEKEYGIEQMGKHLNNYQAQIQMQSGKGQKRKEDGPDSDVPYAYNSQDEVEDEEEDYEFDYEEDYQEHKANKNKYIP